MGGLVLVCLTLIARLILVELLARLLLALQQRLQNLGMRLQRLQNLVMFRKQHLQRAPLLLLLPRLLLRMLRLQRLHRLQMHV